MHMFVVVWKIGSKEYGVVDVNWKCGDCVPVNLCKREDLRISVPEIDYDKLDEELLTDFLATIDDAVGDILWQVGGNDWLYINNWVNFKSSDSARVTQEECVKDIAINLQSVLEDIGVLLSLVDMANSWLLFFLICAGGLVED